MNKKKALLNRACFVAIFFVTGMANNLIFYYSSIDVMPSLFIYSLKIVGVLYLLKIGSFKSYKSFQFIYLGVFLLFCNELLLVLDLQFDDFYYYSVIIWAITLLGCFVMFIPFNNFLWSPKGSSVLRVPKFRFSIMEFWVSILFFYVVGILVADFNVHFMKVFNFLIVIKTIFLYRLKPKKAKSS